MSFIIPTFTAVQAQVISDIESITNTALLQQDPLYAIAMAQAYQIASLYQSASTIANTSLPTNATGEVLEAWARLIGLARKEPTPSVSLITLQGAPGTVIPEGTILIREDGATFTTDNLVTAGNQVGVTSQGTGAVQNSIAALLTVQTPITNLSPYAVTDVPITGGSDSETDADLLARFIQSFSTPKGGGNAADYVEWALKVNSVSRAWANPLGGGAGSVVIYVMEDDANAAEGGFPQGSNGVAAGEGRGTAATGDQLAVANFIFQQQPVGALVYVHAPTPEPVNVVIQGLTNDSTAVRASILSALTGLFLTSVATPLGAEISLPRITATIQNAVGVGDFNLAQPTQGVSAPVGSLPVLGTIAYQ